MNDKLISQYDILVSQYKELVPEKNKQTGFYRI